MIKEILNKLDEMKKECHEIVFEKEYEYWEELDENIMFASKTLNL